MAGAVQALCDARHIRDMVGRWRRRTAPDDPSVTALRHLPNM